MVRTLDALHPRITFLLNATNTPGYPLAAICMPQRQFSSASATGFAMDNWLPVITTGIAIFCSINASIDDVYAMVSVP